MPHWYAFENPLANNPITLETNPFNDPRVRTIPKINITTFPIFIENLYHITFLMSVRPIEFINSSPFELVNRPLSISNCA